MRQRIYVAIIAASVGNEGPVLTLQPHGAEQFDLVLDCDGVSGALAASAFRAWADMIDPTKDNVPQATPDESPPPSSRDVSDLERGLLEALTNVRDWLLAAKEARDA